MELMKRSDQGLFASRSFTAHVLRGAVGMGLLAWALLHQTSMVLSLGAGVGALLALRGCPVCWTIGLVETAAQCLRNRRNGDTRQR